MALEKTIVHCLFDAEPEAYHDDSDMLKALAVNLGFECVTDITRKQAAEDKTRPNQLDADEHDAEELFGAFLIDARTVEFHIYRAAIASPLCKLTYVGKIDVRFSETPDGDSDTNVTDWLGKADPNANRPNNTNTTHYWATPTAAAGADTSIDAKVAPATYRLRAAHSWNAPVAHRQALTHIVRPKDIQPTLKYAILPFFAPPVVPTADIDGTAFAGDERQWEFAYDAGGSIGEIICRTEVLDADKDFGLPKELFERFINPQGYLKVQPEAENLWRITKWFEERAASLMAPMRALSGPAAGGDSNKIEDGRYEALFAWTYDQTDKKNPLIVAPAAAWLAATSLTASLDNIVIGIMKPVSGEHSAGDVIAPLLIELFTLFQGKIAYAFDLNEEKYELSKLTGLLRAVLGTSNLLGATFDPHAVARNLRHVHGIAEADDAKKQLLDALLAYFVTGQPVRIDPKLIIDEQEQYQLLNRLLAEVEQRLQDEAGTEVTIVRLFETVEIQSGKKLPELFADQYMAVFPAVTGTEAELRAAIISAFSDAWTSYRTLLDSTFNGAEAVRRASSAEFTKALLLFANADQTISIPENPPVALPQHLIRLVKEANYHDERILRIDGVAKSPARPIDCFWQITDRLVRVPFFAGWPADADKDVLRGFFKSAYVNAIAPIEEVLEKAARFIPDMSPAPLPIQIAVGIDSTDLDEFAGHFNGIAVAIRRLDAGNDPSVENNTDAWAHANLAALTWPVPPPLRAGETEPNPTVVAAIHPILPASSDGRGQMFVQYEGMPFAATTFRNTAADPVLEPGGNNTSFYLHQVAGLADKEGFAKVPRLAYGRWVQSFSFGLTNAGALPLKLGDDNYPWRPIPTVQPPKKADGSIDEALVSTTAYQRRTAIGQIAVDEQPSAKVPRRIGVPLDGVVPVSEDYPRTVISAFADSTGVRDLFRERGGAGTLTVPAVAGRWGWLMSGVVFGGKPAKLTARLFNKAPAGPTDDGLGAVVLEFPDGFNFAGVEEIEFVIEQVDTGGIQLTRRAFMICGDARESLDLDFENIESGWIRLSIESKPKTEGEKDTESVASLSFAVTDAIKPYEVAGPLLLLAPAAGAWKPGLSEPVTVKITTPRVGYLDFERWFANADLRKVLTDKDAVNLQRALLTAYVLRDADTDLAGYLDRLPDPSVEAINVELAIQDQLGAATMDTLSVHHQLAFGEKLSKIAAGLVDDQVWNIELLKTEIFEPIEENFTCLLTLGPGTFGLGLSKHGLSATVPEGTVARLSIDALVPKRHFNAYKMHPAVFHEGLAQHAQREIGAVENLKYYAYPSTAIRIETMLNDLTAIDVIPGADEATKPALEIVEWMIAVHPVERSRRYDLETRSALPEKIGQWNRHWRLLSEIDVTSQRWRPSGRPIYNHVDPMQFRDISVLSDPSLADRPYAVLPLVRQPHNKTKTDVLARFEQEAFFDRPNVDSQTITKRLSPLPSRTVLEQHFWDSPSATYFRHRFTLRSRYAGALLKLADREVKAWITKLVDKQTPADAWTMRIALLADLSRILLTRPQQRALIPLTSAPHDGGERPSAPPILSILQEPPFSRGGLADRIAAEIKTGFGYGFEEHKPTVEILDSRKEIGPDPRLNYSALAEDIALGMALSAEGPMGLTFDQVNASAPAFPNSMLSLLPVHMGGKDVNFEEHFLGVSMRRYIDPNWTMKGSDIVVAPVDAERCWWMHHEIKDKSKDIVLYQVAGEAKRYPLLMLEGPESGEYVIKTMKAAVDSGSATADKPDVPIARWDAKFADTFAILHQPVAPGRYSTSVFVMPKEDQDGVVLGRSNAPLMAASFEWGPPKSDQIPAVALIAYGSTLSTTMASASTFLAWTRTGRNFDYVHLSDFDGGDDEAQTRTRDLIARLDGEMLTFDRSGFAKRAWLCSSTFRKPIPLHVHRHLAVLTTRYLDEPGRAIEEYCRSALLLGNATKLLDRRTVAKSPDTEDCVRIVEFETPAAILCGSEGPIPPTYKKAYFDLISTGFPSKGEGELAIAVRLLFRFVGTADHLRKFVTLAMTFTYPGQDGHKPPINVTLDQSETRFVTGVELILERKSKLKPPAEKLLLLYSDGTTAPASYTGGVGDFGFLGTSNRDPGFSISIAATGGAAAGEFWADVSLLHSPRSPSETGFEFDWLFSQSGGAEPASEVTPAGLNRMVETQARIVSVSQPIPITSVKP